MKLKSINNKNLYALASFILPLLVYSLTAARTITSYGDNAELTTAAFNLDAAHPPGYPLYIMLGKLFTSIPIGSIAFRVNLLSCTLAALTIFFIYKIFRKLGLPALSSLIASQIVALNYSLWLYSITAEKYALNNLFAVIIIYLTTLWAEKRKSKENKKATTILYLTAFIFGLAFSNHTSIILLAPGLFYVFWVLDRSIIYNKIIKLAPFFILGFTPFILLAYSANTPHYPIFGIIPNPSRIFAYITRVDYGGLFSAGPNLIPNIEGIRELFFYYSKLVFNCFTPVAPLLALYFAISSLIKKQTIFTSLSITLLSTVLLFPLFFLRRAGIADLHSQGVIERFALLGMLILGITFLLGLYQIISNYLPKKKEPIFRIITLTLAIILFVSNYSSVNKKNFFLSHNYALNILNQVEPNSIIFTSDDMTIFSLMYFVNAEKIKPDITLINTDFLEIVAYQKELITYWPELFQTGSIYSYDIARDIINTNQGKRPVYFVMLRDPYPLGFNGNPYYLTPMGLVLKADTSASIKTLKENSSVNYWNNYELSDLKKDYKDPFAKLAKHNYSFKAQVNTNIYYNAGCRPCAQQDISALSIISDNPQELQQMLSSQQLPKPQPIKESAQDYLISAEQYIAEAAGGSMLYLHRAIWDLQTAIELDPQNKKAKARLTEVFNSIGLYDLEKSTQE